uniref:Uncharacterized protein n=1 Tax=Arundo donax TaxID=35708 RepID=A0A0A9FVU1_ARUDO
MHQFILSTFVISLTLDH